MTTVVYVGPSEAVEVNGVTFPHGKAMQVDAHLAARLLEQPDAFVERKSKPERAVNPPPETRGPNMRSR